MYETRDQIRDAVIVATKAVIEQPEFKARVEVAVQKAIDDNFEKVVADTVREALRQRTYGLIKEAAFYNRSRDLSVQWLEENKELVKEKVDEACKAFVDGGDIVFYNAARHHLTQLISDLAEKAVSNILRRRQAREKKKVAVKNRTRG